MFLMHSSELCRNIAHPSDYNLQLTFVAHYRPRTSVIANDGKWHHICLAWRSPGGKAYFYYDKRQLSASGYSEGEEIPGKDVKSM